VPDNATSTDSHQDVVETFIIVAGGITNQSINVYVTKGTLAHVKQVARHNFYHVWVYAMRPSGGSQGGAPWGGTHLMHVGYAAPTGVFDDHIRAAANEFSVMSRETAATMLARAVQTLEERFAIRFDFTTARGQTPEELSPGEY
jgi:hypothetical protein